MATSHILILKRFSMEPKFPLILNPFIESLSLMFWGTMIDWGVVITSRENINTINIDALVAKGADLFLA